MKYAKLLLMGTVVLMASCKNFLEIDPPKSSLVQQTVFQSDEQATSALAGIYTTMANSGYASGDQSSITCLGGLSADELTGFSSGLIPFYENQLSPEITAVQSVYTGAYSTIYTANAVIEGLEGSDRVTPPVKKQLEGEACFLRAFAYFYLVNLYGPVPIQLSTDYRETQVAARATTEQVYQQILSDLVKAEGLVSANYMNAGRARPNKSAVQALLARVYLYKKDWENAEKYASLVIGNPVYKLVDLDAVFLSTSQEAIWQLMPPAGSNTKDGNLFVLNTTPTTVSLRNDFADHTFEASDKRRFSWVGNVKFGTQIYYYPNKYKVKSSSTVTEYSMVLRLAEQYLIRAEARVNQAGKIEAGIDDLNTIRARSRPAPSSTVPNPLPEIPKSISKSAALDALNQERKAELFCEWGHRWLDLKRLERVTEVMTAIKTEWQNTDVLYPIPLNEVSRNHNISQNEGY